MSHRWIANVVPIWLDSGFCTSLKPLSWMRQWNDIEAVVKELPDLDLTSWTKELYSVFASCLILWMLKQWSICPKLFLGGHYPIWSHLKFVFDHNYLHIPICQCLCQARALSCRFGGWPELMMLDCLWSGEMAMGTCHRSNACLAFRQRDLAELIAWPLSNYDTRKLLFCTYKSRIDS